MATETSTDGGDADPRLSRRHAAGAGSARGLLFTVLGELVLPAGGSAWTSAFIDVLGRLGVEEKAVRQALMRTGSDGWLIPDRVGRRTSWRLSPNAERLLTEGTERIFGFRATMPDWDGRWLLVLARAPDRDRSTRHLLRSRLGWAGFGSPGPGIWVSTHAERLGEVEAVLTEVGLLPGAQIFRAEQAGGWDLQTMVRQAWDLEEIEALYARFVSDLSAPEAGDPLAGVVELVHRWRRFPSIDPELPEPLLPEGWRGVEAARLFERRHAAWAPPAREAWGELSR